MAELDQLLSLASTPRVSGVETLVQALVAGNYYDILTEPSVRALFTISSTSVKSVFVSLRNHLREILKDSDEETKSRVVLTGVACLFIFIQSNWTGPPLSIPLSPLNSLNEAADAGEDVPAFLLSELTLAGEEVWSKLTLPAYLLVAKTIFCDCALALRSIPSAAWWQLRTEFVHQNLLAEPVPTLRDTLKDLSADIIRLYANHADKNLAAQAYLETGLIEHYYRDRKEARDAFVAAQKLAGLNVELTGVMGTRTKHQVDATAQLVLKADLSSSQKAVVKAEEPAVVPQTVAGDEGLKITYSDAGVKEVGAEDDDVLDQPEFMKVADDTLLPIHQAILLALCLNVKNHNPHHGITSEEMAPYLDRVANNPQSHALHSMCLLLRSRIERERSRVRERAVLQMQALVDQFNMTTVSDAAKRLRDFFLVLWPSRRDAQKELAEVMLNVGMAATAFELYQTLELWQEAADCLVVMDKPKRAIDLVQQQLATRPTPRLLCLLGELTKDTTCFEKAWTLSGDRFSMAKRLLGNYALKAEEFGEAVRHYQDALAINYLYPKTWFALGCAYIRLERWEDALTAFTRTVHQDPEEADAWNNMGSVYLQLNKKEESWRCFKEACKLRYDNAKLWENLMFLSMDVGDFQEAIYAFTRVLEITGTNVNLRVLNSLIRAAADPEGFSERRVWESFVRLLFRAVEMATNAVPSDPDIWKMASTFFTAVGDVKECQLRECRCVQKAGWDRDNDLFCNVVSSVCRLADTYIKLGDAASLHSATDYLRPLDTFEGTSFHQQLKDKLSQLELLLPSSS